MDATPRNASGLTAWLAQQDGRNDAIGDLAREVALDTCWPKRPASLATFERRLTGTHHARDEVIDALHEAWAEYEAATVGGHVA